MGLLVAAQGADAAAKRVNAVPSRRPTAETARKAVLETASLEFPSLDTPEQARTLVAALQGSRGVQSAVIDVRTRLGVVHFNAADTGLERLLRTCREAGQEANEYRVESRFPKPVKLKGG